MKNTKTALITGSSRGIGKATALRLAEDGFKIIINYKNDSSQKEVRAIARLLQRKKREFLIVQADITKENEVARMILETEDRFGTLDVLVNNAGINKTESFSGFNLDDFNHILDTNLKASVLVTKYALPLLRRSTDPKIIFLSSSNSFIGSNSRLSYVVSKSGVNGITRALALELAPKILVNTVVPGYIETRMTRFSPKALKEKLKKIPCNRLGQPNEVAKLISFLVSNQNTYITGQCIHIDGGMFLS